MTKYTYLNIPCTIQRLARNYSVQAYITDRLLENEYHPPALCLFWLKLHYENITLKQELKYEPNINKTVDRRFASR